MLAHWGFWEWIAYSAIAIAAIVSALDLGLKHAPMVAQFIPSFVRGPVFGLLPFCAILVSAGIFGASQLGLIHPKTAAHSEQSDITGSIPAVRFEEGAMPSWVQVALGEYDEARAVGRQSNPRILEYLRSIPGNETATDKVDWASAFAEWSLNQVGISGPKRMNPRAWATWGREIKYPSVGAIAVFNFQGTEHVAFILGETDDSVIAVGGNQVDRVQTRRYFKREVVTYRMPPSDVIKADSLVPKGVH